jgi:hypothetical protein
MSTRAKQINRGWCSLSRKSDSTGLSVPTKAKQSYTERGSVSRRCDLVITKRAHHQCYLHLIVVVVFESPLHSENYAGDCLVTGRATHVRQVKGLEPDKK